MTRIGVILGSTRPGRRGEQVARWVMDQARSRTDAEFELVDLADYPLPHLDEPLPPSMGQYQNAHTNDWASRRRVAGIPSGERRATRPGTCAVKEDGLTIPAGSEPASGGARRPLGPFHVAPIGFGAMRLTGPGVFGPPSNREDAVLLLREAVSAGVDHIDTAEYYGPRVVNELIREALHPYPPGLVLVSKVGARRDDRGGIFAADEPSQLRRGIEENLLTLGVDSLPVVNLRLMRGAQPDSFFDDQLAAMIKARDDGLIGAVGLSNVTLPHLLHALRFTGIACVQNAYHPANRSSQPVLDECTRHGIAFVPFSPLGSGARGAGSALAAPEVLRAAARLGCSPVQVTLAWALNAAPNILLIPGTASRAHLRENLAASSVRLDAEAVRELSRLSHASW